MISIMTVAGAISGLIAGHLADRIGYKLVYYLSFGMSTPSLYLFLYLPGNWKYVGAFFAGFSIMATMAIGVAMAQKIALKGKAMVASLMMGLAFGTGGMMAPITGKLADIFSIRPVLSCLAIIPLLTMGLIYRFPEGELNHRSQVTEDSLG
jgi:FSR family fosmidomycin resistance protein-like MFS transporter